MKLFKDLTTKEIIEFQQWGKEELQALRAYRWMLAPCHSKRTNTTPSAEAERFASPVCYLGEFEEAQSGPRARGQLDLENGTHRTENDLY